MKTLFGMLILIIGLGVVHQVTPEASLSPFEIQMVDSLRHLHIQCYFLDEKIDSHGIVNVIAVPEQQPWISLSDSALVEAGRAELSQLIERDTSIRECSIVEINYDKQDVLAARGWEFGSYEPGFGWWFVQVISN